MFVCNLQSGSYTWLVSLGWAYMQAAGTPQIWLASFTDHIMRGVSEGSRGEALVKVVIRHHFYLSFSIHFNPTSPPSLSMPIHFLCLSFLCVITLTTRQQGHNLIGINTPDWLLLTLAVGPPHDLLGYGVPKTVHLQLNYQILHQNSFSDFLHFPPIKVQDFPNMGHE